MVHAEETPIDHRCLALGSSAEKVFSFFDYWPKSYPATVVCSLQPCFSENWFKMRKTEGKKGDTLT